MKILIDGDACPVIGISVQIGAEKGIPVTIICDYCHKIEYPSAETIIVDKGADSADFILANRVTEGDIVITQDYGLAAICLSKKACIINQNGLIYNNENIDSLLLSRHINKKVRRGGGRTAHIRKRTSEDDKRFEKKLREVIDKKS